VYLKKLACFRDKNRLKRIKTISTLNEILILRQKSVLFRKNLAGIIIFSTSTIFSGKLKLDYGYV